MAVRCGIQVLTLDLASHAPARAERRKRRETYPELLRSRRCRLVVLGIETGGRWSDKAASFVRLLARAMALMQC